MIVFTENPKALRLETRVVLEVKPASDGAEGDRAELVRIVSP